MPLKSDTDIAREAYNATVHPSNPSFDGINNPTFLGNLLHEVKNAVNGKTENSAYGYAVAALVAVRNIEIAKEQGLPYTDEKGNFVPASPPVHVVAAAASVPTALPHAVNVPFVDAVGNPLPTPRPPAPGEFPVTHFATPAIHADVIAAKDAQAKADAAAKAKADEDAAKASDVAQK